MSAKERPILFSAPMVRVLVCGGRNYGDATRVFMVLDRINAESPIDILIHGGAFGADALANKWALTRAVQIAAFPVSGEQWRRRGKGEGPRRNQLMLDLCQPSIVVAFPGGTGTADMLRRAKATGASPQAIHEVQP